MFLFFLNFVIEFEFRVTDVLLNDRIVYRQKLNAISPY